MLFADSRPRLRCYAGITKIMEPVSPLRPGREGSSRQSPLAFAIAVCEPPYSSECCRLGRKQHTKHCRVGLFARTKWHPQSFSGCNSELPKRMWLHVHVLRREGGYCQAKGMLEGTK